MRGARQTSFQPRTASSSHAGCTASRRPARRAVRSAPRMRGGADCSVRTRCRQADCKSIASSAARPSCMPASAAALARWRRVLAGLNSACCGVTSGRVSGAAAAGGAGTAVAVWRPRPRPRRPRPPPPRAVEARTRVAAAARRVSSSPTGSSSVGASSGASASRSRCAVLA